VRERGAGNLTFDELVQESGVTRGGITYHFATKADLLRALVQADLEQWCALETCVKPKGASAEAAELIAYIRGHTAGNKDRRRFVAGMLSAATLDHTLLDPVREHAHERCAGIKWNERQLKLQLLRLASEGFFWSEVFGCGGLPPNVRKRLVSLMEKLAREWTEPTH
jgi:AcrR family transcriptional regulator